MEQIKIYIGILRYFLIVIFLILTFNFIMKKHSLKKLNPEYFNIIIFCFLIIDLFQNLYILIEYLILLSVIYIDIL